MKNFNKSFLVTIFITSVVLFCAFNLNAQVFFPGPAVDLPAGYGPYQVITADFNGDSKEDLAVTSYLGNKVSIWLGNGDGSLSDRMDYTAGTSPRSITAGDFNADNKVDIAVTNFSSNTVSILLGNGDGTFLTNVDYSTGTGPSFVTTGDFNGDNKIDLVVTNYNSTSVSVLIGNGDGTFLSKVDYLTGAGPSSVSTGDFNGDSKIDLVVANYWYSNTVSVLLGNGDGTFLSKVDYATGLWPISVTTGDFNGDNKVDLAVATYSSMTISVLLGNGDGTFLSKVDYPIGVNPRSITSGDFNGDNKIDLAVATCNTYFYLSTASVFIGNGDGTFSSKVEYASGRGPYSITTGDFNGDNNLDLALANYSSSTASLLIGNGDGTFLSRIDYTIGQTRLPVTTGDFNGDNKVDVVVAFPTKALIGVLLGNGDGTFLPEVDYATGVYPYSVRAADFNGDNKVDIAVPNYNGNTVSILLGNGNGTFIDKVDYSTGINPTSVTAEDFNGDNKLDLAVANYAGNTVSILIGNGDGTFMGKVDYGTGGRPISVVAGDFNGDYKSDLALANNTSGSISVLIGNGNGTFLPKVDYLASYAPNSVRIGDFNADNNLDLATSNSAQYQGSISIFLGNGNGTFQSKVDYASGLEHTSLGVADFNGDNIPDLATPNFHASIISVLIANGDGTFANKVSYGTELYPYDLTTADFNGDFKPDIAVTTYNGVLSILFNQSPSNQPPTDISLSNSIVNENSLVGAVIGILSATNSNPGVTFTFSEVDDPDNKFSVVGNELRVDGALDFETTTSHSITIRVTDASNLTYDEQFVIIVNNVNETPTNIILSNSTVYENVPVGTVIGILSATDPDAGATFTFSEINDLDNKFTIAVNELRVDGALDFETAPSHTVTIRVTDNGGLAFDKQFTITVNDVSEGKVVVNLFDSQNNGLSGGEVQYYDGGWQDAGVTINGILSFNYEGDKDKLSIKMKWNGYTQQLTNQDISSPIVFQTLNSKLKLIDSEGNGIAYGEAQYYSSGWREFGVTGNDGNTPGIELLPGTYSFKMQYAGYTQQISNVNISLNNPLTFSTQKMIVKLNNSNGNGIPGGVVTYYASGWREFGITDNDGNTPGVELLPGTYSFKMQYAGYTQQKSNIDIVTTNPLIYQTVKMYVKLIDSDENGVVGGEVNYYASGWKDFGVTGNDGNTPGVELLPGIYSFKMQYAGYTQQISNVNISLNNPLTFSTQKMIVKLNNSSGNGVPGGVVTYYASGWKDFGVTGNDGNTPGVELLPGTYSFRMQYTGYTKQISNVDISLNNPLIFSTQSMIVKLNNSSGNGISGGVVTYYASGWKNFGVTDNDGNTPGVELLPGTYSFKINYSGMTTQKSNIDINLENPLVFEYSGGALAKNGNNENEWVALEVPTEYTLKQNYPNPFNPTTTIEFSLPEDASNVTLSVYNAVGEEISIILNEEKSTGYYRVEFDGADLTTGVYFYRLKAGDFLDTKKMILIK